MPLAALRVRHVLAKAAREKNVRRHWIVFPPHFFDGRIHFAHGVAERRGNIISGQARPSKFACQRGSKCLLRRGGKLVNFHQRDPDGAVCPSHDRCVAAPRDRGEDRGFA